MLKNRVVDPSSRRTLGGTGLSVSPLCVGCAPLGDMPETFDYSVDEDRARETLRAVLDSQINFLDTAASYGDGESERRIGGMLEEMGACQRASYWPPRRIGTSRPETSPESRCAAPSSVPCGY
jgi:diketogulonate reductase-like aldo/keto reductase